jgi:hypothetical protein
MYHGNAASSGRDRHRALYQRCAFAEIVVSRLADASVLPSGDNTAVRTMDDEHRQLDCECCIPPMLLNSKATFTEVSDE